MAARREGIVLPARRQAYVGGHLPGQKPGTQRGAATVFRRQLLEPRINLLAHRQQLRVAVVMYAAGLLQAVTTVLARRSRWFGPAMSAFLIGAVLHTVSIVERTRQIGHLPVENFFNTASLCALVMAAAFLLR